MMRTLLLTVFSIVASLGASAAADRVITLASTTSTEQSGFFSYILPIFRAQTGISVRVLAVGSGQALAIAKRGDADAVLVHDPASEEIFVAEGHGIDRRMVMFNDFLFLGPSADPAQIRKAGSAQEALKRLAEAKALFVSRGDASGTHKMEMRLWTSAAVVPAGKWYREIGQGMGQTIRTAAELGAYTISDRATWASFKMRGDLEVLFEGDPELVNPYSSILVASKDMREEQRSAAEIWHEWLTSPQGRAAIEGFKIHGQQVFFLSVGEAQGKWEK